MRMALLAWSLPVALIAASCASAPGRPSPAPLTWPSVGKPDATLVLSDLMAAGVALAPGRAPADVSTELSRDDGTDRSFAREPHRTMLYDLGAQRIAANFLVFDCECITNTGDYRKLAERLCALAGADLPLAGIVDHVDLIEDVAWIEFSIDGRKERWDLTVRDDWIDPQFVHRLAKLLTQRRTGRRFVELKSRDQCFNIGCVTAEQLAALRALGLDVAWIE